MITNKKAHYGNDGPVNSFVENDYTPVWDKLSQCGVPSDTTAYMKLRPNDKRPDGDAKNEANQWHTVFPSTACHWVEGGGNIGIIPGKLGLVVIDIDLKGGINGWDALADLEHCLGKLPPTLKARTPSGGFHLYFQSPWAAQIAKFNGKLGEFTLEGIDIIASSGYVLTAPSKIQTVTIDSDGIEETCKGDYQWANHLPVAHLPQSYETAFIHKQIAGYNAKQLEYEKREIAQKHYGYSLDELCNLLRETEDSGGNRNATLNKVSFIAGQLSEARGWAENTVQQAFESATAHWKHDWLPLEFVATFNHAFKDGQNKPIDSSQEAAAYISGSAYQPVIKSLREIRNTVYPPRRWLVEGLLPAGLTFLVGDSKIGKSWMSLDLSLSIANGTTFLGRECEKGTVLILYLEDGEEEWQERYEAFIEHHQPSDEAGDCIHFVINKIVGDPLAGLSVLVKQVQPTLVIVDTLTRFIDISKGSGDAYQKGVRGLAPLQEFAVQQNIGILCIHHTSKDESKENPYNTINGSKAIMATSDATWLLSRKHEETLGKMHVTGRKVESANLAVEFKGLRWHYIGDASQLGKTNQQREIIEFLRCHGQRTLKDNATGLNRKVDATRKLLQRMSRDKLIRLQADGTYALLANGILDMDSMLEVCQPGLELGIQDKTPEVNHA